MTEKSCIVFGATGAVGKPLIASLISSTFYSKVHAFVRTPFKDQSNFKDEAKLVEHIIDFDKLLKDDVEQIQSIREVCAEAVYITCE